jgi:D-ribose pyranase
MGQIPMKKGGILNPAICSLLAELGHQDELLIVDAGYPLPLDGHVIDLTLTPGIPRFLDVFRAVAEELVIEGITLASEIHEYSPRLYEEIAKIIGREVDIDEVPHHEFKEQSEGVKGIIRTAEFTPYANVRILCGCAF